MYILRAGREETHLWGVVKLPQEGAEGLAVRGGHFALPRSENGESDYIL